MAAAMPGSACGHRTLTSIQSCCRTPGNQETTSKMARCRFVFVFHPVTELQDMALQVRVPLDWTVRSGPGSLPYLQQNEWNWSVGRDCSHMSPSLPSRKAHVERGPVSGVTPSRSAVAIIHRTFCNTSVGDLCMVVQFVPVPGPPALSVIA